MVFAAVVVALYPIAIELIPAADAYVPIPIELFPVLFAANPIATDCVACPDCAALDPIAIAFAS